MTIEKVNFIVQKNRKPSHVKAVHLTVAGQIVCGRRESAWRVTRTPELVTCDNCRKVFARMTGGL